MPESRYEFGARRVRQARNVFLLSQAAALDLARMSSLEAARLDFPEARAKRLAEWLGKPGISLEDAMQIYTSVSRLVEITDAKRISNRETEPAEEATPVVDGSSVGSENANDGASKTRPLTETGISDGRAEAEADRAFGGDAMEASNDIEYALEAAGLPEYASFRAIQLLIKIQAEKSRSALMLESLLLSAVAQFEVLVSRLMLTSIRLDPSPLEDSEKMYTFSDVTEHPSLEAFSVAAANAYVDGLMYKGMDSWMKFLTRVTRTDMVWVTDLLAEVIMRRNVHVHAGGVASSQYLSELGKRAGNARVGDELPVTAEYLEDALNRMARAAVVLSQAAVSAICSGAKQDKSSSHGIDQDRGIVEASFDLLTSGRYGAVEHLAEQLDSLVATNFTRERLRANSLAARKALYGVEAIRPDLEDWDVTAAEDEIVLAKHCLQDEIAEARVIYESLSAANKISVMELATWPILEPLRAAIEAEQRAGVAGESDEPRGETETKAEADAEAEPPVETEGD
ncbi:hypothetical protein AA0Z99_07895 [Agrococcus sp. 1P02AA]|uniref:hypothetical protein n=1 Tax=Agrococcus sp. 1P02AA TaxID=3132259 RepID=UPI0039A4487B